MNRSLALRVGFLLLVLVATACTALIAAINPPARTVSRPSVARVVSPTANAPSPLARSGVVTPTLSPSAGGVVTPTILAKASPIMTPTVAVSSTHGPVVRATAASSADGVLPLRALIAGGLQAASQPATVDLLNPNASAATAHLVFFTTSGRVAGADIALAAKTRRSVPVAALTTLDGYFGLAIHAGVPIAAGITLAHPGHDGDGLTSVAALRTMWYIAAGSTALLSHEVLTILNPDVTHQAHVVVHVLSDGASRPEGKLTFVVPASAQAAEDLNRLLPDRLIGLVVTSDQPVVVAQVLSFSPGANGLEAHTAEGEPGKLWRFAGGTAIASSAVVSILNPSSSSMTTTVRCLNSQGHTFERRSVVTAGFSRSTVRLGASSGPSCATLIVSAPRPIVVERQIEVATPWGTRAGAIDAGAVRDHIRWAFPGANGANLTLMVYNPHAQPITIATTAYNDGVAQKIAPIVLAPFGSATRTMGRGVILTSIDGAPFVATAEAVAADHSSLRLIHGLPW